MLIIRSKDIRLSHKEVGKKTLYLKQLTDLGLAVPSFLAIPSTTIVKLYHDGSFNRDMLGEVVEEIKLNLKCEWYAVRSSALIEDDLQYSRAGQFLSLTNLQPEGLSDAIKKTISHANTYLKDNLGKFSLIVQEFIKANYGGVTFTRNPLGSGEMAIEFHKGSTNQVVKGEGKHTNYFFRWNQKNSNNPNLPHFETAVNHFKKIETSLGRPQDVEWCIKDGIWYFLQSRPITTIHDDEYKAFLLLDRALPPEGNFLYEKTELSEAAPRPTPLTLDLLKHMYSQHGPVAKVYKKYKIEYEEKNIFQIFGNELFINRERELQSILPAFSYFSGNQIVTPHFSTLKGIGQTLRNLFFLPGISSQNVDLLEKNILKSLGANEHSSSTSLSSTLSHFLNQYELIFEVNLLTGSILKKLDHQLQVRGLELNLSIIVHKLTEDVSWELSRLLPDDYKSWKGNLLELSDMSPFFVTVLDPPIKKKEKINATLPTELSPLLGEVQTLLRLRQIAHWLAIKATNNLRNLAISLQKSLRLPTINHIFFTTFAELIDKSVKTTIVAERKKEYDSFATYDFPARISSWHITQNNKPTGVSIGTAKGMLTDLEHLPKSGKEYILYTKSLDPHLAPYFRNVKGIVSEEGGLLSHLAILARENKIPVIVNVNLKKIGIQMGDSIFIDSEKGIIQKWNAQ